MPRYRIGNEQTTTFVADALRVPGDEIDYAGWPGSTLIPIDSVAKRIKARYDEARARGRKLPPVPDLAEFADPPTPEEDAAEPAARPPKPRKPKPPQKPPEE